MITEIFIVLISIVLLLSYRGLFSLASTLLEKIVEAYAACITINNMIRMFS